MEVSSAADTRSSEGLWPMLLPGAGPATNGDGRAGAAPTAFDEGAIAGTDLFIPSMSCFRNPDIVGFEAVEG